ncbi:MAG: enoyl-CoA hydratase-related protein [Woeseiaceae bacterium]|nr:enoyl-CoA hydratase-related protein [Woeseiaceae bacterium]
MTAEGTVAFWSADHVGQIVFDRPPANAYDLNFHEQFNAAIEAADNDDDTRVIIVMSAVPRFFCAGADVKAFAANSTADNKRMVASARSALARIEASGKPFIALLEGHTLGGGLEIAMACDMRFAADADFKLGLPEARLGLLPGNGGSQRLPRIVGTSQAMRLLTSGESIDPQEALRIGLVDRLFPAADAREQTEGFARNVAEAAPLAVAAAKRAVYEGLGMSLADGLALESQLVDELYDTEDASEGFNAAIDKRTPHFKGK